MHVIESWFLFFLFLLRLGSPWDHGVRCRNTIHTHILTQSTRTEMRGKLRVSTKAGLIFFALLILEFLWRKWARKRRKTLCLGDRQLGHGSVGALPLFLLRFPFLFFFLLICFLFIFHELWYSRFDVYALGQAPGHTDKAKALEA